MIIFNPGSKIFCPIYNKLLGFLVRLIFIYYFIVAVPPRWQIEPTDANVAAGQDVMLDCQAIGYPVPSVMWRKSIGEHFAIKKTIKIKK